MAKSAVYKAGEGGKVEINLTPMIDVTFQLIIFFILAGQMASAALAQLKLHRPVESRAIKEKDMRVPNKVIVNVVSRGAKGDEQDDPFLSGRAKAYMVRGEEVKLMDADSRLPDLMRRYRQEARAAGHEEFFVEVRADKRVNYSHVQPVMMAAAKAGIAKMNITALLNVGD